MSIEQKRQSEIVISGQVKLCSLAQIWHASRDNLNAVLKTPEHLRDMDLNNLRLNAVWMYRNTKMLDSDATRYANDPDFKMVLTMSLTAVKAHINKKSVVLEPLTSPGKPDAKLTARVTSVEELRCSKAFDFNRPTELVIAKVRYIGAGSEISRGLPSATYTLRPGEWVTYTTPDDILGVRVSYDSALRGHISNAAMKFVRYTAPSRHFGVLAEADRCTEINRLMSADDFKEAWRKLSTGSCLVEGDTAKSYYLYISPLADAFLLTTGAVFWSLPDT